MQVYLASVFYIIILNFNELVLINARVMHTRKRERFSCVRVCVCACVCESESNYQTVSADSTSAH